MFAKTKLESGRSGGNIVRDRSTDALKISKKNMADQTESKPFWSSLPGMFTGIGAVIVAVTGLITALYTTGVIGSKADTKAAAPANTSVALAATPAPANPENERYKNLAGNWEVVETPALDFEDEKRVTKRYEATVSGNVLTLNGKILAVGVDKNLTEEEESISSTIVTTLIGSGGLGEYRVKRMDGTTVIYDTTIRLADDLKQFQGKIDAEGQTYKLTARKL